MRTPMGDPELLHHYQVAIYPFRHHQSCFISCDWLGGLDQRWAPWPTRFSDADLAASLEATAFFLPYIRGKLYPEIASLQKDSPTEDPAGWVRRIRGWCDGSLTSYARHLAPHSVLRLTCRPALARALGSFDLLSRPDADHGLPGVIDWVEAVLFPSGIGFLLLQARLASPQPRLSEMIRLAQGLRQVHPANQGAQLPVFSFDNGPELTLRQLLGDLVRGLVGPWDIPDEEKSLFPGPAHPGEVFYPDTTDGRTYGERCHLLSFACADLTGYSAEELPAGPFASGIERILFEQATCIPLGDSVHNPVWVPSVEQARKLADRQVRLWRCWSGMVLKEAVVFLGTEDLPYNKKSLPKHIENDYLPLYLYTLYQKLQLFAFSTDLMHEVASSTLNHPAGARALLQRFVAFRSQFWFDEVTRKPQGSELYRLFQQGLGVPGLYTLVTNSVKEVKEYYEGVWARQVQWVRDVLTYGGPATVAMGTARMFLNGSRTEWPLGGMLAILCVGVLVFCLGIGRGAGLRRLLHLVRKAWGRRPGLSRRAARSRLSSGMLTPAPVAGSATPLPPGT